MLGDPNYDVRQKYLRLVMLGTPKHDIRLGWKSVGIVGIMCAQLVFSNSEAGSISPFSHIQISHGVLMQ